MANTNREKQNANLLRGNPKTQFNGRTATEAQKKSVKAHYEKKARERIFRDDLLKTMTEEDWAKILQGAIDRATDSKADLELLLAVIGQKPVDKQQMDINATVSYEEMLRRMREGRGQS